METIEKAETDFGRADARVDEGAGNMLDSLGVKRDENGKLPDVVVETYKDFRAVVDAIQPGAPMRAGDWAFVLNLAKLKTQLGA